LWDSVDGNGETSVAIATCDTILTINATNSRGAFINCQGGDLKQTFSFIAYKTGTVTTFKVGIYELNANNGLDWIYTSPDLSSSLISGSGNQTVIFYQMADADAYTTDASSKYCLIAEMTGSGSVGIQGKVFPVATTASRPLYPGILRNPSASGSFPTSVTPTDMDSDTVKETPYFQTGTLEDIQPQSFFTDFSSLTTNLWYFNTKFTGGLGPVKNLAVSSDNILYMPAGGANGTAAITYKYMVATDQCRVGVSLASAITANPLRATMFQRLDLSSGVTLQIAPQDSTHALLSLGIQTAIDTVTIFSGVVVPLSRLGLGAWVYLEYDPTDGNYRIYVDPDWDSPDLRDDTLSDDTKMMWFEYNEGAVITVPGGATIYLADVDKSSTARSGSIILYQTSGGVRSTYVDDWRLEDWAPSVSS
jgi:hypothetical protein